jgi:DNA (cytosine-5)-methyltransferase 1
MSSFNNSSYRLISLFSGAGGLTLGFTKEFNHNFNVVLAHDIDEDCVKTYNENFSQPSLNEDIEDLLKNSNTTIPLADVVIGSLPMGFSRYFNESEISCTEVNYLTPKFWKYFFEIVKLSNAKIFVLEHKKEILNQRSIHKKILDSLTNLGFNIAWSNLCTADFGVPQRRQCVFLIGCRFTHPTNFFPPQQTHNELNNRFSLTSLEPWRTVRDAISDLPPPKKCFFLQDSKLLSLHCSKEPTNRQLKFYQSILSGSKSRTNHFYRLEWDQPAPSISPLNKCLHPEEHRQLTGRELARLHSFPDHFVFLGHPDIIYRQIGNAVPPLMAARIADCVYALLSSRPKEAENYNITKFSSFSDFQIESKTEKINVSIKLNENIIDGEIVNENSLAIELSEQLKQIKPGREQFTEYESICVEIFNYLFFPSLSEPKIQVPSTNGLDRMDAVYRIRDHQKELWHMVRNQFKSFFVVAEFKNLTDAPTQEEVRDIEKYLDKVALRLFGILCSRKKASDSALKARTRYWRASEKMIILLCDEDLKKMLQLKAVNQDPEEVIMEQLSDFLMTLSS